MLYAVNSSGGFRLIKSNVDLIAGETVSTTKPVIAAPTANAILIRSAKTALAATDVSVARILEAVSIGATTLTTADVVAFMQYRTALRSILSGKSTDTVLPTQPPYPANT